MMKNILLLWLPILFVVLSSCTTNSGEACDVKTVLLEETSFPRKVSSDPIYVPVSDDVPQESASKYFYVHSGSVVDGVDQLIINFRSVRRASNFYADREEHVFDRLVTPTRIETSGLISDQSHLECGFVLGLKTCRWMARYQTYYLYLRADISDIAMTQDLFLGAVKEIDSRMVQCLGN